MEVQIVYLVEKKIVERGRKIDLTQLTRALAGATMLEEETMQVVY
jgi:hypothetical protein